MNTNKNTNKHKHNCFPGTVQSPCQRISTNEAHSSSAWRCRSWGSRTAGVSLCTIDCTTPHSFRTRARRGFRPIAWPPNACKHFCNLVHPGPLTSCEHNQINPGPFRRHCLVRYVSIKCVPTIANTIYVSENIRAHNQMFPPPQRLANFNPNNVLLHVHCIIIESCMSSLVVNPETSSRIVSQGHDT